MALKEKKDEGARAFSAFIRDVCDGQAHTELSKELRELLQSLETEAGLRSVASGELTLKLGIKLDAAGKADIKYEITTKAPKPLRTVGVAWLTPGSNLVFENPRQQKLPLVDVNRTREVADSDGGGGRAVADV